VFDPLDPIALYPVDHYVGNVKWRKGKPKVTLP